MTEETVPPWFFRQSAVVPYRTGPGGLEVLLITSRGGKRWIIPKGVIDPGETARSSAAREAEEEAGVYGTVHPEPCGHYRYDKWGGTCDVEVFPMRVEAVLEEWPESFRQRRWCTLDAAAELVSDPAVAKIILGLESIIFS